MLELAIRAATHADEDALGRFGGALMRQHHGLDPDRFLRSENPDAGYGRFLVSQLGDPDCAVLVAERAGHAVGYAYAVLEPMGWKDLRAACGYLHDVFVEPDGRPPARISRRARSAAARRELPATARRSPRTRRRGTTATGG